jgi:hypothetical protein
MDVKGTALVVLPAFIRQRFGEQGYRQWLAALTPGTRRDFEAGIGINEWFPIKEYYTGPTQELCRLFYGGSLDGAWQVGRFSADYALRGVYRAFVKLSSVKFFVRRAGVMLPTYYRPCAIEVLANEDLKTVVRITQFPDPSPAAEHRIGGWMQRGYEIHGCRNVGAEITKALSRGDFFTEFIITWEQ